MYIYRTRPKYSDEELAALYSEQYNHTKWEDHVFRVEKTIEFAKAQMSMDKDIPITKIIDLSCGDAEIAKALSQKDGYADLILGDLTPGWDYCGPIEKIGPNLGLLTLDSLWILTETLEHLDNPLDVLSMIAYRTGCLLLSTPIHKYPEVDENEQHYWAWDREGVETFTRAAGFEPLAYDEIYNGMGYRYGLWWFE